MNKDRFIEGKTVFLRPLYERDAEGAYPSWLNDEQVCQGNSHGVFPYSYKKALDYIAQANQTNSALVLAILLKENNKHVGNIALQDIHWIYRTADLAILLGDKEQWGKGVGFEAAALMLRHAFMVLNLNRVSCGTFENNVGMSKLAIKLGMKKEGVRRKAVFKNGRYLDLFEFGILKEEFEMDEVAYPFTSTIC